MKRIVCFLLLIFSSMSVLAQDYHIKSGIVGGVSLDWYKDNLAPGYGYSLPDASVSFHAGYQFQFDLKRKFSIDAALLYGQKRGEFTSPYGYEVLPSHGYKEDFSRHYLALNGVVNYNLIGGLKLGAGIEPTLHFRERIFQENIIKSSFDIPIVLKVGYSFKYFDIALLYKHGTCNVIQNVPSIKEGRTRDLQFSIFIPIFR